MGRSLSDKKLQVIQEEVERIVAREFQSLAEILSRAKDSPKGKKAAIIEELATLPAFFKVFLEKFMQEMKERAGKGYVMPSAQARRIFDDAWEEYLKEAARLEEERRAMVSSPGFVKFMHTPISS